MGHLFQDECWEKKSYCGCPFGLLWLRKLANKMEKLLERLQAFIWHFISETNGS